MSPDQLSRAESVLTPKELEALNKIVGTQSKLSPAIAAQFFGLFLQGYTTERIANQNPTYGAIGLGLIVRARIELNWDEERDRHVRELMLGVRQAVEKTTLEGVMFSNDGMAVYHKLIGDRFRKYLQTGDPKALGEFEHMSFKVYKDFVELFQKLTGQGQKQAPGVQVEFHNDAPETVTVTPEVGGRPRLPDQGPVSAETAASLLEFLSQEKK